MILIISYATKNFKLETNTIKGSKFIAFQNDIIVKNKGVKDIKIFENLSLQISLILVQTNKKIKKLLKRF